MSLLDSLLGNNSSNIADRDVAFDILKDSKFSVSSLTKASMETVNSQLRQMIDTQLTNALNSHHELADMMIKKGWYAAHDDPNQQLQKSIAESPQKYKQES